MLLYLNHGSLSILFLLPLHLYALWVSEHPYWMCIFWALGWQKSSCTGSYTPATCCWGPWHPVQMIHIPLELVPQIFPHPIVAVPNADGLGKNLDPWLLLPPHAVKTKRYILILPPLISGMFACLSILLLLWFGQPLTLSGQLSMCTCLFYFLLHAGARTTINLVL